MPSRLAKRSNFRCILALEMHRSPLEVPPVRGLCGKLKSASGTKPTSNQRLASANDSQSSTILFKAAQNEARSSE